MTNRLIAITVTIMIALGVSAHSLWYDVPIDIAPGFTEIGTIPQGATEATIHLRFAVNTDRHTSMILIWNHANDDNFTRLIISVPKINNTEYIFSDQPYAKIENVVGGIPTLLYESKLQTGFDMNGDFNSLKLVYDDGFASLYYGNSDEQLLCQVPFSKGGGAVAFVCDEPVKCQRIQCDFKANDAIGMSKFADFAALKSYLLQSNDVNEGIWEYLDRKIDADKAMLGGFYTFATVRYGNGYDIIYIKGADVNKDAWKPMMIKGRLLPTIFEGNFDMLWYDAQGNELSEDVNAQLSSDASMLTLRFPLVSAEVRFCRLSH